MPFYALDVEGVMQLHLLVALIYLILLQLQLSKLHGLPSCGAITSEKHDETCCQYQ
jgi:hypothetical protein